MSSYLRTFIDFVAASVDHLMTLVVGIGPAMYSLNYPNPQIQSLAFCKIRGYIFQIGLMLSRWYVAFACIDRYTLTSDKVRLRNFACLKIAHRVIIAVIVVWSIICSHRLIFYEIKDNICGIVNSMPAALYHSAYVIIGGGVLPTGIMITCALFIYRNLVHKQQRRRQLTVSQRQERPFNQQLLRLLITQIIFYIIFIIPQLCNLVFNTVSITIPNRSKEYLAVEQFVQFIAELMLYLFPVTSFYLYTLTSRTFRKELIKFLRATHLLKPANEVRPTFGSTRANYHLENQDRTATVIVN